VQSPGFTPDVAGQYGLRVKVTDSTGRSTLSGPLLVTVNNCGASAPVVASIAQTPAGSVPIGVGVSLAPTVTDADITGCGQAATFGFQWSFEELPAGSQATLSGASGRVPAFSPDVPGAYVVGVVATDATGRASAKTTATVTASSCGTNSPSATIALEPGSPMLAAAVRVTASASDNDNVSPCGPPLPLQTFSYRWSFDAMPAGSQAFFSDPTARAATFRPDVAGAYGVRVKVTDSTGRASETVLALTVSACGGNTPVVTGFTPASPIGAAVGATVRATGLFDDADNNPGCQAAAFLNGVAQTFTYGWRFAQLPAGSQARLNDAASLAPSLTPDVRGDYVLQFTVTDSTGRTSAPGTFTVTAADCGDSAPNAGPTASPAAGANLGSVVQLSAGASDPDNGCLAQSQALSCQWSFVQLPAGSLAAFNNPSACNPSFVPDKDATTTPYLARVVVTDSTGRKSPAREVSVTTNGSCGGNAPVALAAATAVLAPPVSAGPGANVTLTLPLACPLVQLDGQPSYDADNGPGCGLGQPLSFRWSQFAAPAGSEALLSSVSAANPWFVPDQGGTFVFRLLASDGKLDSPTPAVVNVVSPGNEVGTVVDPAGGEFTSLALHPVSGRPRIAYSIPGNRMLHYARCDEFCNTSSAVWRLFSIDTDVDFVSLTLAPDGTPHLAYRKLPGGAVVGDLKYATCTANCDSGTPTWATSVVEAGVQTTTTVTCTFGGFTFTFTINVDRSAGRFSSIALNGTGQPMIGYNRSLESRRLGGFGFGGATFLSGALRYAVFDGATWLQTTVDQATQNLCTAGGTNLTGQGTSIAVAPGGDPRISYYDATGGDLRYAACTAGCATASPTFQLSAVDTAGDVGGYSSIRVAASGSSRISYYDATNGDLKYASCTAGCGTSTPTWNLFPVDTGGNVGRFASLALDSAGGPQVAYYDSTAGNLRLAACVSSCGDAQTPAW
ncbi:MAG: hypothetical protein ACYC8T_24275, partial [Myxococcaceae bacterium]